MCHADICDCDDLGQCPCKVLLLLLTSCLKHLYFLSTDILGTLEALTRCYFKVLLNLCAYFSPMLIYGEHS